MTVIAQMKDGPNPSERTIILMIVIMIVVMLVSTRHAVALRKLKHIGIDNDTHSCPYKTSNSGMQVDKSPVGMISFSQD